MFLSYEGEYARKDNFQFAAVPKPRARVLERSRGGASSDPGPEKVYFLPDKGIVHCRRR